MVVFALIVFVLVCIKLSCLITVEFFGAFILGFTRFNGFDVTVEAKLRIGLLFRPNLFCSKFINGTGLRDELFFSCCGKSGGGVEYSPEVGGGCFKLGIPIDGWFIKQLVTAPATAAAAFITIFGGGIDKSIVEEVVGPPEKFGGGPFKFGGGPFKFVGGAWRFGGGAFKFGGGALSLGGRALRFGGGAFNWGGGTLKLLVLIVGGGWLSVADEGRCIAELILACCGCWFDIKLPRFVKDFEAESVGSAVSIFAADGGGIEKFNGGGGRVNPAGFNGALVAATFGGGIEVSAIG